MSLFLLNKPLCQSRPNYRHLGASLRGLRSCANSRHADARRRRSSDLSIRGPPTRTTATSIPFSRNPTLPERLRRMAANFAKPPDLLR